MPWGAVVGAVISAGMGAAGQMGAFSGSAEKRTPTPGEINAGLESRRAYNIGRKIQVPLDQMSREDLRYMKSAQGMRNAGSAGVNQFWRQAGPNLGAGLQSAAATGGAGSGRFWGTMGQGASALEAGIRDANTQGRIGGLNQYMARQSQFLNRRTNDLKTGLAGMTGGAGMAAAAQEQRIRAQNASNAAMSQAIGQIGGSVAGAVGGAASGMMGSSGAGAGAETGVSTMQPQLQQAASSNAGFQYLYGNGAMPTTIGGIYVG